MIRSRGTISIWLFGLVSPFFAGVNINEPYLISLRGLAAAALLISSIVVLIFIIKRGCRNGRGIAGRLLILPWCLPSMLYADTLFEVRKRNVLQTDVVRARTLGQHFVVGYSSLDEVVLLAGKGLIAGVYIARHNIAGRTAEGAELRDCRASGMAACCRPAASDRRCRSGGWHCVTSVAAIDGNPLAVHLGGSTARPSGEEGGRLRAYSRAGIGGTWCESRFCTGLDLRPEASRYRFDFNTLINQRAISGDAATVADIALACVRGLEAFNVGATVKHFPGLGRVRTDTHHFSVNLDTPLAVLEASDWRPFRDVLAGSKQD
jgi:beta-N-acetylhexosaminidase